jgi:carbon-monoxide dehydrogenase large subunit
MNAPLIGRAVKRKEDFRFITGQGHYTADFTKPSQAFAVFARCPHAHARIKSIDAREALALKGVLAVLTGADMAADKIQGLVCGWTIHSRDGSVMKAGAHPALASERARHSGEPVAVVIGETYAAAKDGAENLAVDYEPLSAVLAPAEAQASGAPQLHEQAPHNRIYSWTLGDEKKTAEAFSKAAHIVDISLVNNRLVPNAIEPRAAIGEYDAGSGTFTLTTTSQNPHVARLVLSAFVQIAPEHKLRVIAPDVGGGFGSKIFIYPEETVCLWAAKRVGRPVRWTAERSESFLADAHGRDHVSGAALALDADGKFLALRVKTIANLGAYLSTFSSAVPTYLYATLLSGQYDIPAIFAEVEAVYTNTAPVDAYRGAGRPEATFVVERLVEEAARALKLDPAEIRRRNFIRTFPHETPVIMTYDIGDYEASLDAAMRLADVAGFAGRKSEAAQRGKKRGLGYSTYIEACGIAPSQAVGSLGAGVGLWESAEVRVNPTGSVEVLTGSHSHGQGHETTFAQFVAEKLGVSIDQIEVVHGDTDKVQFGMGTYGSRSAAVGLSAISRATDKVIAKAKRIAAYVMEVPEADVSFEDGRFAGAHTNKTLSFAELALAAYVGHKFPTGEVEPGLKESAFYDPLNFTFPAGCHVCEVEIDPETGHVEIARFTAVDDFGKVINPMIVEGQVHGGIAQGVGQALLEHGIYDRESGQLVTGSYMDYAMPRADDLPDFKVGMTETPCPSNPLGVKGCGEAGAIAAPAAVVNAITDALGVKEFDMPATPEKVWRAMKANA